MSLAITLCGLYYAPEHTGSAPYISGIASGLAARGHDVRVVTGFPHYPSWDVGDVPWRDTERLEGVEVTRLRHYVPRQPTAARRVVYETSFGVRAATARWGRPDVVLLTSPPLLSSVLTSSRARWGRRRPPFGVIVHDLYAKGVAENAVAGGGAAGPIARLESATLRAADGVTVVHERFREIVRDELAVPDEKITVIPNWSHVTPVSGVDRAAVRASHGWNDEVVVLHAGNMGAKQGLDHVVEAGRIAQTRSAAVRFVLMGDGNQRSELERLARGVDTVQLLGSLPDRAFLETLAAADVLLVHEKPGQSESAVPSKLTSYFAAGNAVLGAVDPAGLTALELQRSGGGVVVPSGRPDELVQAALDLGRDLERREVLAASGLRYTQEALSEKRALDRYDDWVRALASGGGPVRETP